MNKFSQFTQTLDFKDYNDFSYVVYSFGKTALDTTSKNADTAHLKFHNF